MRSTGAAVLRLACTICEETEATFFEKPLCVCLSACGDIFLARIQALLGGAFPNAQPATKLAENGCAEALRVSFEACGREALVLPPQKHDNWWYAEKTDSEALDGDTSSSSDGELSDRTAAPLIWRDFTLALAFGVPALLAITESSQ